MSATRNTEPSASKTNANAASIPPSATLLTVELILLFCFNFCPTSHKDSAHATDAVATAVGAQKPRADVTAGATDGGSLPSALTVTAEIAEAVSVKHAESLTVLCVVGVKSASDGEVLFRLSQPTLLHHDDAL